jgi:hypothetical protein
MRTYAASQKTRFNRKEHAGRNSFLPGIDQPQGLIARHPRHEKTLDKKRGQPAFHEIVLHTNQRTLSQPCRKHIRRIPDLQNAPSKSRENTSGLKVEGAAEIRRRRLKKERRRRAGYLKKSLMTAATW